MMEKQLIPKLRFPEFKSEFVKFEFSEIAKRGKKSYNPNKDSENLPCIELESLTQETGQLIKTFDSINLKSNKTRFSKNEVLFGKLRPYLKKYLLTTFEGVCTSEIWVFQGKLVSNPFLYYLIQTDKFNFEANVSSGSKMPRTDWDYLSGIKFSIPNNSKEQQKIASFLSDVDAKITKLTKKKDLLEKYKKGVMQKIFNQELRFKDDNGNEFPAWVEKKMNDFTKINQGLQIPISERYTEEFDGGYFYITNEFLKENSPNKYYIKNPSTSVICKREDILMTRTGNTGMVVTDVEGVFHNNFFKIDYHNKSCNKVFLVNFLRYKPTQNVIMRLAGTSTIPDLNHSDFYRIKIALPCLEEQTKIADFLSDIDLKIEALNIKIENSKSFKKGLLQQMFV